MPVEPLRATRAARRLGVPTKEILRLALERKIRYLLVEGLVHFPEDALVEYQGKAS
jgi:hypothetical protein